MRSLSAALAALLLLAATARAGEDDKVFGCHKLPADSKMTLTFKPGTSLGELAVWASGFTCKNIVFTDGAAGCRVTIVAPAPVTPKKAWELFTATLATYDLVVVEKPDLVTIREKPGALRCNGFTSAPTPPTPGPPMPGPPPEAVPDPLDPVIGGGIHRVDDTHYTITAAARARIDERSSDVARAARIVPAIKDGKPNGFKMYAIRPDGVFARLGLQNGDTIHSLNGLDMSTPDATLRVFASEKNAPVWTLGISRRGGEILIEIRQVP